LQGENIMGIRGELYTEQVKGENRTYFFNVKENTRGDVFLQIVESKMNEGAGFDRHAVVIFESEMQPFLQGFDKCIEFIEKNKTKKFKEIMKKREMRKQKEQENGKNKTTSQKKTKRVVAKIHKNNKENSDGKKRQIYQKRNKT